MKISRLKDRAKERMSRYSKARLGIAFVALIIVLFFSVKIYGYIVKEEVKSLEKIQAENGIPVDVVWAKKGEFRVFRTFSGMVRGLRQSELTTDLSTRVIKVYLEEGDSVKEGEILVSLDPDDPSMSTGHYRQDLAKYRQALRDYKRVKELYDVGAVSKSEYENALTIYEIARADHDASKDMVEIASPINGTITEITVSEGDPVFSGEIIATVAVTEKVRVELNISSNRAMFIKKGQPARVVLKTTEKTIIVNGEVESISLSANKNSGLFEAKILLDNVDGLLKLGTIINLEILIYSIDDALVIPNKALINIDDETFVFVVDPIDGKETAIKTKIVTGWKSEETVEVKEGLKAGDRIVIRGQNKLSDKTFVYLHNEDK